MATIRESIEMPGRRLDAFVRIIDAPPTLVPIAAAQVVIAAPPVPPQSRLLMAIKVLGSGLLVLVVFAGCFYGISFLVKL